MNNHIKYFQQFINEQATGYVVNGSVFSMFGTSQVDLRIVDPAGNIVASKGGSGASPEAAYDLAVKALKAEIATKKLPSNLVIPQLKDLTTEG